MTFFSAVREIAEGLKLGARFALTEKHGFVERGIQPSVSRCDRETFGR